MLVITTTDVVLGLPLRARRTCKVGAGAGGKRPPNKLESAEKHEALNRQRKKERQAAMAEIQAQKQQLALADRRALLLKVC